MLYSKMYNIDKGDIAKLLSQCIRVVTCYRCKSYFTSVVRCICGSACCAACWCGACTSCGSRCDPERDEQTRVLTKRVRTLVDAFQKCFTYDMEEIVSSVRSDVTNIVASWLNRSKNDFSPVILESDRIDQDEIRAIPEEGPNQVRHSRRKRSNQSDEHKIDKQWSNVKRMRNEFNKLTKINKSNSNVSKKAETHFNINNDNKENKNAQTKVMHADNAQTTHTRIPFLLKGKTQPLVRARDDIRITITTGNTKTEIVINKKRQVDVIANTETCVGTAPGTEQNTTSADTNTAEERGTQTDEQIHEDTPKQSQNIFSEKYHALQSDEMPFTDMEDSDEVVEGTPVRPAKSESAVMSERTARADFAHVEYHSTPVARESFDGRLGDAAGEPSTAAPVVAGSCLSAADARLLREEASRRGWRYSSAYCPELTHLVLSADDGGRAQRSVKYMLALAAGRWLVDARWLRALAALPAHAPPPDESEFEVRDCSGAEGPRLSRLSSRKLFEGLTFHCLPPFALLDVQTLHTMIESSGGRVVGNVSDLGNNSPVLLLAELSDTQDVDYTCEWRPTSSA